MRSEGEKNNKYKVVDSSKELMIAYEEMNEIWDKLSREGVFSNEIYKSLYSLIKNKAFLLDKKKGIFFLNQLQKDFIHETSFMKSNSMEEKKMINDISSIILAEQKKILEEAA